METVVMFGEGSVYVIPGASYSGFGCLLLLAKDIYALMSWFLHDPCRALWVAKEFLMEGSNVKWRRLPIHYHWNSVFQCWLPSYFWLKTLYVDILLLV
ncbi:hypothetical protein TorRG33x02_247440 [Trema orientale]|uniref:Uncharacterized protein n=1 Tax=Trema orientale TaxID=63057 RepID=A0A2P5DLM2_TREOI|nr:hypothetical protein TorRG33x02_247440 [Trema orientale]